MKKPKYKKECPFCGVGLVVPSWSICQSKICAQTRTNLNREKRREKLKKQLLKKTK